MVNDENVKMLVNMFVYHNSHAEGVDTSTYQTHVAQSLTHISEDIYRFQLVTHCHHDASEPLILACQLLGSLHTPLYDQVTDNVAGTVGNTFSTTLGGVDGTKRD